MARATGSGTCELCGHHDGETALVRHLAACAPAHDAGGAPEPLVQLRVSTRGEPRYWLHVEARATSTLERVDALLRRVWLECCGHLSAFRVGRQEIPQGRKVGDVFTHRGQVFDYEYDFGSTTALVGKVTGAREGSIGRAATRLLARNDAIDWRCAECDQTAVVVCPYCVYDGDCVFCERHGQLHEHAEEEVYLPVVNSPRMGVCGYTG